MALRIRPPSEAYQSITGWAEANVILPEGNAFPGPLRLVSYQRGILEAYTDAKVRRITMMMASQIGKTQLVSIMVGYDICNQPQPFMLVCATENDTKKFLRGKFKPFVDTCPELARRVATPRSGKGEFNVQGVDFQGGHLTLAHSGSDSNLRSLTVSRVIADEVDVYSPSADGNPLGVIAQRMITYGDRGKMVILSTPTVKGQSAIEREFLNGDQRRFYVPCPHCGAFDVMRWGRVALDVAQYSCGECGVLWTEQERVAAVAGGEWRATKPFTGHASFHLTQLCSPFVTLARTVEDYRDNDARSFHTQALAEPYEEVEQTDIAEDELARYVVATTTCPQPAAITCGIDVQEDRLEYQIVAWQPPRACVLHHGVIPVMRAGGGLSAWYEVRQALAKFEPDMTFADASYKPDFVRDGIKQYLPLAYNRGTVRDIQGMSGSSFGVPAVDAKRKRASSLAIGTDELKLGMYDMIHAGEVSFVESGINTHFLRQFASERLETVHSKSSGKSKMQWVKTHERNEALDCFVYALAAAKHLEQEWPGYNRMAAANTPIVVVDVPV